MPFDFTNASFDTIIPAMGTRYDVSLSSFTDTLERQKQVDMVTYFIGRHLVLRDQRARTAT